MNAQYSVPPLKGSEDSIKWFSCMNRILSYEESEYLASNIEKADGKYNLNSEKKKNLIIVVKEKFYLQLVMQY